MDRWVLSRVAGLAAAVGDRLADYDALAATRHIDTFVEDLSTWYVRLSRRRFSRNDDAADRDAAFATLHAVLVVLARVLAPILPFVSDTMYANLMPTVDPAAPPSVHLTRWPSDEIGSFREPALETAMAVGRRAVDLARTLRGTAGLRVRQPLARMWLALPGGTLIEREALLDLVAREVNVKSVELIGDESDLVERRVRPLLPKIGKRLGPAIPAVMAAASKGRFDIRDDGSVELGGQILAPDEVEIQATPRPGTVVAHDEGLVVVLDTELTRELRAEGDARELQRAVQDLRKDAGLALDDRIELWVVGLSPDVAAHLDAVATETLADLAGNDSGPDGDGVYRAEVSLDGGPARIALRRVSTGR
jgi:isoleucyl-tRNA synthetase